jgi:hypothetical protein
MNTCRIACSSATRADLDQSIGRLQAPQIGADKCSIDCLSLSMECQLSRLSIIRISRLVRQGVARARPLRIYRMRSRAAFSRAFRRHTSLPEMESAAKPIDYRWRRLASDPEWGRLYRNRRRRRSSQQRSAGASTARRIWSTYRQEAGEAYQWKIM